MTTGFVDLELDADPEKITTLEATKVEIREVQEADLPLSTHRPCLHQSHTSAMHSTMLHLRSCAW